MSAPPRSADLHFERPLVVSACVFITAGPITKLFAGGGGGADEAEGDARGDTNDTGRDGCRPGARLDTGRAQPRAVCAHALQRQPLARVTRPPAAATPVPPAHSEGVAKDARVLDPKTNIYFQGPPDR